MTRPPVSIIVNTYNRAPSLRVTLGSFELLDYPNFEVVVVNGPSTDASEDVLAEFVGRIKVGRCENANLAESRNIGLGLATGQIVAFIDDDAYPDPAWLDHLVKAFDDPEVAAAGGPVFDHTGWSYQCWFFECDRFGNGNWYYRSWDNGLDPSRDLAFPGSKRFVFTIGTNSAFHRRLLVEMGGFDEEFEYQLEEADVCARLIDRGYIVRALDDAFTYHKALPSEIRDRNDILKEYYKYLKSTFYFALKFGLESHSLAEVCAALSEFVDRTAARVDEGVLDGRLTEADRTKFHRDVPRASDAALARHLSETPRTRDPAWFAELERPFLRFPIRRATADKLHICLLSREYPPARVNGIGRLVHALAIGLAADGHLVRVLTSGQGHNRVDLEDSVWVHRIVASDHLQPSDVQVPPLVWSHSAAMRDELQRLDAIRPIDVVHAPNWGAEGLATIRDGRWRVVLGLHTPLVTVAAMDPTVGGGFAPHDPLLDSMIRCDRFAYENAAGYLAAGPSIVAEIERGYDITIDRARLQLVPHGLADLAPGVTPEARTAGVNVLFVGRLEVRKGIDTLLESAALLASELADVALTLVGDATLHAPDGVTYRERFERDHPELGTRVHFLGPVDDRRLASLYAGCDIFVAPSRFESFGLILVEAMMFAKPVIGTDVGGMRDIVENGRSGLLVPPGDAGALRDALAQLISSPQLRRSMGNRGREIYEERYTIPVMVEGVVAQYRSVIARSERVPAAAS